MSFEKFGSGSIAITGKESIALYRLMTLRKGIELEGKGIKVKRGMSCLSIVKKEWGWKGNRAKILGLLDEVIEEATAIEIMADFLPPDVLFH